MAQSQKQQRDRTRRVWPDTIDIASLAKGVVKNVRRLSESQRQALLRFGPADKDEAFKAGVILANSIEADLRHQGFARKTRVGYGLVPHWGHAKRATRPVDRVEIAIEKAAERLLQSDNLERARSELVEENAARRAAFLKTHTTLTSADLARAAGRRAANRSVYASKLKARGEAFAVRHQGRDLFPAFQFDADHRPLRVIAEILRLLPKDWTAWQIALWFDSENGWLGGKRPLSCLGGKGDSILSAAAREGEVFIG